MVKITDRQTIHGLTFVKGTIDGGEFEVSIDGGKVEDVKGNLNEIGLRRLQEYHDKDLEKSEVFGGQDPEPEEMKHIRRISHIEDAEESIKKALEGLDQYRVNHTSTFFSLKDALTNLHNAKSESLKVIGIK